MTTQLQVDTPPRFLPLQKQPLPPKRLTLRLARLVGWVGTSVLALLLVMAFFPRAVAPYDSTERVATEANCRNYFRHQRSGAGFIE
jgi:hypothetical protein